MIIVCRVYSVAEMVIQLFSVLGIILGGLYFWRGMWNLGSQTRDQTHAVCIEVQSLNHWLPGKPLR